MHLTWWDLATSIPTLLIAVWLLRVLRRLRRAGRPLPSERVIQAVLAVAVANHIAWVTLDELLPWLPWVTLAVTLVFPYSYLLLRLRQHLRAPAVPTLAREDPPGP